MPTKKRTSKRKWSDPDEAPRLGRDWFERAEIREGEKIVRLDRQSRINEDLRKAAKLKA